MRLPMLFFLLTFVSCSPKISTSNSANPLFVTPEKVYYFFENNEWIAGTPDELDDIGSNKEFSREMFKTMKYPALARESGIQGTVLITVIQDETGQITSSEIKKGIGKGCEEEALRVLRLAAAKRRLPPIYKNGMPMIVKYDIPIRFKFE